VADDLEHPEQIDRRLGWQPGTAARQARRGKLPHYVLPNGDLRLRWDEVNSLVRHVTAVHDAQAAAERGGYLEECRGGGAGRGVGDMTEQS
jgi:hypothetical protein